MITVKLKTPRIQYMRLQDFKNNVNQQLLKKASDIAKCNNEEIDLHSVKYTILPVGKPSRGCGCTQTIEVTLTAETIENYKTIKRELKYIKQTKLK